MFQYDLTMKKIFQVEEEALIKFFAEISLKEPQSLNVEFQTIESRTGDLIFQGSLGGKRTIVHFEFQSYR